MAIAGCDTGPVPVWGRTNLSLIAVWLASGPH